MSRAEFSQQIEQDGWSDVDSEDSLSGDSKLTFGELLTIFVILKDGV